jgi:phosphoglycerate dehydrogenase-like enzyme
MPAGHVRDTFIPEEAAMKLMALGDVVLNNSEEQFSPEELKEKIMDADIALTGWSTPMLDEFILKDARNLKLVAHTGGSVTPIAGDYLYNKGIKIISGNWLYAESVAEGTIAYILASQRNIVQYNNVVQNCSWKDDNSYNEGLLDQTVGIVGFGMVAKNLVRLLKPFRTKICVHADYLTEADCKHFGIKKVSLEELVKTCRIISVHESQRPETYHMISRELLGMIPDGALLINTSRGSVIDEKAMADELGKKRFRAVLDVYEEEPLPAGSGLRGLDNVILIPHMAGPTIDRRKFVTLGLIEDIQRLLRNEKLEYEISREYAARMTK